MKYRETIPFPPIFPPKSKPRIGATRELLLFTFASCGANQSEAWILGSFWGQWNCCHLLHTKPPITSNFFSLVLFSKASSASPSKWNVARCNEGDGRKEVTHFKFVLGKSFSALGVVVHLSQTGAIHWCPRCSLRFLADV